MAASRLHVSIAGSITRFLGSNAIERIPTSSGKKLCVPSSFDISLQKSLLLYCKRVYIKRIEAVRLFSRRTKALGVDKFIEDLACDPWNTMDTFDTLDDKYHFWKTLFDTSC